MKNVNFAFKLYFFGLKEANKNDVKSFHLDREYLKLFGSNSLDRIIWIKLLFGSNYFDQIFIWNKLLFRSNYYSDQIIILIKLLLKILKIG